MKSSQDFGDLVSMLKEKARADETAASAMATPRMPTDAGATMGKGEKQEQTNKQAGAKEGTCCGQRLPTEMVTGVKL